MQKPFEVQRELFVVAGDLNHPALCELDWVEALLDWSRLEALMSGIYASETGRPSDPSLTLFRALMLGVWYAASDAALSKSLARDLLFRKFCRLDPALFYEDPMRAFLSPLGGAVAGHKGFGLGFVAEIYAGLPEGAGHVASPSVHGGNSAFFIASPSPLKSVHEWREFLVYYSLYERRLLMSRGKRYTAEQIIKILREVEIYSGQGKTVEQAVRSCGISEQTYYRWRKEYGGINVDQARRFKDLEQENLRLRKAVSNLTLDKLILEEALSGKY